MNLLKRVLNPTLTTTLQQMQVGAFVGGSLITVLLTDGFTPVNIASDERPRSFPERFNDTWPTALKGMFVGLVIGAAGIPGIIVVSSVVLSSAARTVYHNKYDIRLDAEGSTVDKI
jgi:hypothetical protein